MDPIYLGPETHLVAKVHQQVGDVGSCDIFDGLVPEPTENVKLKEPAGSR